VSIRQPFAIGKYEVTVAQWKACNKAGGCSHRADLDNPEDNSPMRDVSWRDAQEYIAWLAKVTNKPYRLPTEAEWEYAARGGTQTRYWWGNDLGSGHANCRNCGGEWNKDAPAVVDSFPANAFGLYGTSGGVWEWVADCWHKTYRGAPTDGSAWRKSDCRENVIRGGAWRNDSTYVHSASRFKYDTYVRYLLNGFRVARSLP
jgi:formylglycine-generating enzyme required for sulfatase activity